MMAVVLISLLGALILSLGIRLLMRSKTGDGRCVTIEDYANARGALDAVFAETEAIQRIFSAEDAKFIAHLATPEVQMLFSDERKRLAMKWFRTTRKHVTRLMDIHLRLASNTHDPNPRLELTLTAKYLTFLVASRLAFVLIWLLGPFKAKHVICYAVRQVGNVCSTIDVRIAQVDATRLRSGRHSLVH